jgi:ABC-type nitrate/sulfonate/bicarbonate transport system ATPase subunit
MTASGERIRLEGVSKAFWMDGAWLPVLEDVSLTVKEGELVAIIGPSGCGKSTLLNIIAGLEDPDSGKLLFDGEPASERLGRVAYMHQKDLLFPWRTVLDNTILGLEVRGTPRRAARRRAREMLGTFGLQGFEAQYPAALSGGMRQRAAFLRTALAEQPVVLLDEPFGALDALTRASLHAWLLETWGGLQKTVLLITHDVEEAILLSDRVYVLTARPGRVQAEVTSPLPRPRAYAMTGSPEFTALKAALLETLWAQGLGNGGQP